MFPGNNFLSLRKVAVNVGGTGHLVLDKFPSAPNGCGTT